MTEVVFNDSEKGSMRVGKRFSRQQNGAFSIAIINSDGNEPTKEEYDKALAQAKVRHAQEQREGKPLGGDASDVLGLSFYLDIGDISIPVTDVSRKAMLEDMLFINRRDDMPDASEAMNQYWQNSARDLDELIKRAKSGDMIRIWYSQAPYSLCGFYHTVHLLKDYHCPVSAVPLPCYMQIGTHKISSKISWGEVTPGAFAHYLHLETEITPTVRQAMAEEWQALMDENAPLRVVINGRLHSADADFYDNFIRREIPKDSFRVAQLIGRVLAKNQFGIADGFIAQRIQQMIESGELKVISSNSAFYATVLSKG
jgi:hypothetical protein